MPSAAPAPAPVLASDVELFDARRRRATRCLTVALLMIPAGFITWLWTLSVDREYAVLLWSGVVLTQMIAGIMAVSAAFGARRVAAGASAFGAGGGTITFGILTAVLAPLGWLSGLLLYAVGGAIGGAWGRPLRVRGRIRHPSLRAGSEWTAGARPSADDLDPATRRALEALWLHDAQKEHASVPAFARLSWLLAAVGAPPELMIWAHRAGLEEIDHAQRCFALAAGYGGRTHTAMPMPELLLGGLDLRGDPRATLAVESLRDGCLLEDFNADVAAACARACEAPVTRAVLEQIALEERSHADFSWALIEWLLARDRGDVEAPLRRALADLERTRRPTAVSGDKAALCAAADPEALRRHGRLPDARWAELWALRLAATRGRVEALLADAPARAA